MTNVDEKARLLADELRKAMKDLRAAEARIQVLTRELQKVLDAPRPAAKPKKIVEYPAGRYECAACGQSAIFTQAVSALPECDNCGSREYRGAEPKVTIIEPPAPKRFPAGMYQCAACGARTALVSDTDEVPVCDFCGAARLERL
jgi:predicted nucleic acid-binding Zn ribbon protein